MYQIELLIEYKQIGSVLFLLIRYINHCLLHFLIFLFSI